MWMWMWIKMNLGMQVPGCRWIQVFVTFGVVVLNVGVDGVVVLLWV